MRIEALATRAPVRKEPGQAPAVRRPAGVGAVAIATLAALLLYFVATGVEVLLIEVLRPTEVELAWISDVILGIAFGFAVFLWLHLKWTRMTLSSLERQHVVLDTQLSLAADIQRGLLPPVPADEGGLRWAARLVQAGRIGGDLYDFVQLERGSWLVMVGDVSGKGVPAALVLTSIRTMFRMLTAETTDPGQLVERMSQRLHEDYGGKPYLTCVVLRIDPAEHELVYVNAGHPAGIVVDCLEPDGPPVLLASGGPPAGLFSGQSYATSSLQVEAGAVSILVTDGVTEAFDVLGLAGGDPVASILAQLPRPLAPARICDALIDNTAPALASAVWQDDRTVVSFALDA